MTPTTEAACLLQSGSSYPRRIGFRRPSGEDIFAGIKAGGVSLYFGDEPIYHFDFDGRWQRAFVEGVHYLKGLDPTVRTVGREREGVHLVLRRRTLADPEAVGFDASVRQVAVNLSDDLDSGRLETLSPPETARPIPPAELREFLGRVASWDAPAWASHRDRYHATYGPPPFLPPDCPNALVLQATRGRAFAGGGPPGGPARSAGDFERHAREVAGLLGGRIAQCRDIFLGGADLLRRPVEAVLADLAATARVFPIRPKGGAIGGDDRMGRLATIHAFLDDFRPPLPDAEGWRRLREAHLGRVTLGVESGDPATRAALGRSWDDRDLARTAGDLKAAGIGVGVAVLVGAGGRAAVAAERAATPGLVASLTLGPGDLVSLVDARGLVDRLGLDPLDDGEAEGQTAALKARLTAALPSKGPRVVAYNPDKRWT